jgi:hypothetical protein
MQTKYWLLVVAVLAGAVWYFYDSARIAQTTQQVKTAEAAQVAAQKQADTATKIAQDAKDEAAKRISELQADYARRDAQIVDLLKQRTVIQAADTAQKAQIPNMALNDVASGTRQQLGVAPDQVVPDGEFVKFTAGAARVNLGLLVDGKASAQIVVNQDSQIANFKQQTFDTSEAAKQAADAMNKERDYFMAATKFQQTQVATAEANLSEEKAKKWKSRIKWSAGAVIAVEIIRLALSVKR